MGRIRTLLTIALLSICLAGQTQASCAMDGSPPCQAYWHATAVFAGTVTEISYSPTFQLGEGEARMNYRRRITRFMVQEALRGVNQRQVEIVALEALPTPITLRDGQPGIMTISGGDCYYKFNQGETYLVYAHRQEQQGFLYVGLNRTRPLAQAGEDLEYIRGLAQADASATIFGAVVRHDQSFMEGNMRRHRLVADAVITVRGEGRGWETRTDIEGRYRITGLPPGSYKVSATLPAHLAPAEGEREAQIVARGCAEISFATQADGRLSGRVLDAQGQPVTRLHVDLAPVERSAEAYPQVHRAYPDEEGRYEFKRIPPGRYYLGIRLDGIRDPDFPYPRMYYPGVSAPEQAIVISIAEGQRLEGYDLTLPPRLAERAVEGVVVWPDGRPAAGASVTLMLTEYSYNSPGGSASADDEGRFRLQAFEGMNYWINALVSIPGGNPSQMHAEPQDIPANGNVSAIRLVITSPMGNCRRCRHRYWRNR